MKKHLLSMGYRFVNNVWMKPIGFHVFTFNEEKKEWINFFKNNETPLIWNVEIYDDSKGDFLLWLKGNECYTKTDYHGNQNSNFEFLTIQEQLEFLL